MNPYSIKGLRALATIGKTVVADVDPNTLKDDLVLLIEGFSIPFEESSINPFKDYLFDVSDIAKNTSSEPPEAKSGEIYACWVNELNDWTLPGSDTVQILISQFDQPCEVHFKKCITVQNDTEDFYFYAKLACHRAKVNLNITFRNCAKGDEETHSVPFDNAYHGGRRVDGYQYVSLQMPQDAGKYEVFFSVEYVSYVDDGSSVEPFVFIADARVGLKGVEKTQRLMKDSKISSGGLWMSAQIPCTVENFNFAVIRAGSDTVFVMNNSLEIEYNYFDEEYYVEDNKDVDFSDLEPFEHFVTIGWREMRNPNSEFNTREYLLRHADVDQQDIDPLQHYVLQGKAEDRSLGVFSEILQAIWQDSGQSMPIGSEAQILARAQDLMLPMDIIDTRRLIIVVVPEHNSMSGGIYSFFSIADHIRQTRHIHGYDVIVMTLPNKENLTYLRNSNFRNSETVFRFELLRLFRNVSELQIHIPEYATVGFVRSLPPDLLPYLLHRDSVHVNILNQNIRLMSKEEKFRDLRYIANTIGQSVAHHAYAGQDFADRYNLPTLLLPAHTNLSLYPGLGFEEKENLIIYSDDEAPYRRAVLEKLEELEDYKVVKIRDLTFDHYMELATRCRFSVTFGEGFDGYVAQPIYQGGIGFALYTDEFFPDSSFQQYENFFESEEEMIDQIVPTIRRLEADQKRYEALNKALRAEWDARYSYDDYVERIGKLVRKEYEVFPSKT